MCNFARQQARYGCWLIGSVFCISPTGSCQTPHAIIFHRWHLLYHWVCQAIWSKRNDHLHCNLDLWQIPLLLWASLQARSYLCKWTRTVFPGWNMLPPVWRGLSTLCLPQSRGVVWYFFTLKGISWNILYHWIPKDVPDMVGPWFFRGLIYHQGGHASSRSSTCLQLLVHPAQVTQCYRYVNQCDVMTDDDSDPLWLYYYWGQVN